MAGLTSVLADLTFTLNGLTIGARQDIRVQEVRGLDDLAELRTTDSPRPNEHGVDFGRDLLNGRVVEFDCYGTPRDAGTVLNRLRAALVNVDSTLLISGIPGLPDVQTLGRVRRRKLPMTAELAVGVLRPSFDFETEDPRLFAAAETVLTTGPGTTVGTGVTPPLTPPFTPGGSATGGVVTAENVGFTATPAWFRIDGPVNGFSLLNATQGLAWRYGDTVPAGNWLEVDMDARTVLLNGTSSRRVSMSGTWWDLPPGDSLVYYLPNDAAVGSVMTLRFRSAY